MLPSYLDDRLVAAVAAVPGSRLIGDILVDDFTEFTINSWWVLISPYLQGVIT